MANREFAETPFPAQPDGGRNFAQATRKVAPAAGQDSSRSYGCLKWQPTQEFSLGLPHQSVEFARRLGEIVIPACSPATLVRRNGKVRRCQTAQVQHAPKRIVEIRGFFERQALAVTICLPNAKGRCSQIVKHFQTRLVKMALD
jgi:hypothetical protein